MSARSSPLSSLLTSPHLPFSSPPWITSLLISPPFLLSSPPLFSFLFSSHLLISLPLFLFSSQAFLDLLLLLLSSPPLLLSSPLLFSSLFSSPLFLPNSSPFFYSCTLPSPPFFVAPLLCSFISFYPFSCHFLTSSLLSSSHLLPSPLSILFSPFFGPFIPPFPLLSPHPFPFPSSCLLLSSPPLLCALHIIFSSRHFFSPSFLPLIAYPVFFFPPLFCSTHILSSSSLFSSPFLFSSSLPTLHSYLYSTLLVSSCAPRHLLHLPSLLSYFSSIHPFIPPLISSSLLYSSPLFFPPHFLPSPFPNFLLTPLLASPMASPLFSPSSSLLLFCLPILQSDFLDSFFHLFSLPPSLFSLLSSPLSSSSPILIFFPSSLPPSILSCFLIFFTPLISPYHLLSLIQLSPSSLFLLSPLLLSPFLFPSCLLFPLLISSPPLLLSSLALPIFFSSSPLISPLFSPPHLLSTALVASPHPFFYFLLPLPYSCLTLFPLLSSSSSKL